ncbi:synaptosomal-associated protein 47-like [Octopus vulgaris]|uniref:Synaptosomal-associated protein 47-like n=1 Tax=Octopus vulgaris TaxID=6645 RepID=A0AA36BXB2_OCTVU|nr:synaptosomal-associated protein 47-like [Octopus vulgaris]
MRSTVIFSSLVITLNNSQDIHWFSSFTDRSAVCLTLNHFLRFGLFSKDAKDQPALKESTELGTELLKVAHDSERTLAQAAEKLESQGEQIDNCIAVMYDIEEDLDVSENLIKGLQSWFGQLTTTQKTNDVVDPVVITNKDIPDVHEYEVLYYKMDEDRCPLHSLCDGILRISREAFTLTTPLQAVVENYSWSEISRVYAVTPWELHISHFCLGKPDVNYTIISAHIHKFVKRLATRLKDRFEFMESSQTESLCSDLPIKSSISTQNTSIQERSPTEYKDPMQEQKNASRQLVSDSEAEEVSSILTKIKSMALNINHEETKQNEKLDELTDSVKTATTRVKDQTKQIKKMI